MAMAMTSDDGFPLRNLLIRGILGVEQYGFHGFINVKGLKSLDGTEIVDLKDLTGCYSKNVSGIHY
jgi:tRNA (Thr-GGU) A37 N-methylase